MPKEQSTNVSKDQTARSALQTLDESNSNMGLDHVELAIVQREPPTITTNPIACASSTGSPMQIQLNVPLISPNQILHDLITHKELPLEIHTTLVDKQQLEDEGEDEITAGNFKVVSREEDLPPIISYRHGKKGNKQTHVKEPLPPTRILPKRETSTTR